MGEFLFQWDKRKARVNLQKHGVSFEEAASVFRDRFAVMFGDAEHSQSEDRWIMLGMSEKGRELCVVYVERGLVIRIISARKVSLGEAEAYESNYPKR